MDYLEGGDSLDLLGEAGQSVEEPIRTPTSKSLEDIRDGVVTDSLPRNSKLVHLNIVLGVRSYFILVSDDTGKRAVAALAENLCAKRYGRGDSASKDSEIDDNEDTPFWT